MFKKNMNIFVLFHNPTRLCELFKIIYYILFLFVSFYSNKTLSNKDACQKEVQNKPD